jgi:hypothetical protein
LAEARSTVRSAKPELWTSLCPNTFVSARLYLHIIWRNWRFNSKPATPATIAKDLPWYKKPRHQWLLRTRIGTRRKALTIFTETATTILAAPHLSRTERRRLSEQQARARKAAEAVVLERHVENLRSEVASLTVVWDDNRRIRAQQTLDGLAVQVSCFATCFDDVAYRVFSVATTADKFEAAVEVELTVTLTTLVQVFPKLITGRGPTRLGLRLLGRRLRVPGSATAAWVDGEGVREAEASLQFGVAILAVLHSTIDTQIALSDALIDEKGALLRVE